MGTFIYANIFKINMAKVTTKRYTKSSPKKKKRKKRKTYLGFWG